MVCLNVAGLGSPVPTGVNLICNKARVTSSLLSRHFLIECFTNLLHFSHLSHCPGGGMSYGLLLCSVA